MLFFGTKEADAEQRAAGYEADPEREARHRGRPCNTFAWCGQDFAWCDRCGRPCWEHLYEPGLGKNAGLRKRQSDDDARAMWKRWGKPKGIEFQLPYDPDVPPYPTVISGPEQLAKATTEQPIQDSEHE